MESFSNDVFISYRRNGGSTVASMLKMMLSAKGLLVFMDTHNLGKGRFDKELEQSIKNSRNFILLVTDNIFHSEEVVKEISAFLKLKQELGDQVNFIPVFINGMNGFPDNVPLQLSELKSYNGIKLNEHDFDKDFNKLCSWLETKSKVLLDKVVDLWHEDTATAVFLVEKFSEIFNYSSKDVIVFLKTYFRTEWLKAKSHDLEIDDSLVQTLGDLIATSDAKDIAKSLGLSHLGDKTRVMKNIGHWIQTTDDHTHKLEQSVPDSQSTDRFDTFASILEKMLKNRTEIDRLKNFCNEHRIEVSDKRSAWYLVHGILEKFGDVSELLENLPLSKDELKYIAGDATGNDRGNTAELKQRISDWVNYEIDSVES